MLKVSREGNGFLPCFYVMLPVKITWMVLLEVASLVAACDENRCRSSMMTMKLFHPPQLQLPSLLFLVPLFCFGQVESSCQVNIFRGSRELGVWGVGWRVDSLVCNLHLDHRKLFLHPLIIGN